MAVAALAATAFCSPSPASAQPWSIPVCVQGAYGRVLCDADPYQGRWTFDPYYVGILGPVTDCPPGTVAGNYGQCVPWRLTRGAKCPQPNMWVVDGFCRRYSDRW
jgi:hypothetical protein